MTEAKGLAKYGHMEVEARERCRLEGVDPDKRIQHNAVAFDDDYDESTPMPLSLHYSPSWVFMAAQMHKERLRRGQQV